MLRIIGLFLLGLGITLLMGSGVAFVALVYEREFSGAVGVLACSGLFPVPMIIGGIAIIRRVEDSAAHESNDLDLPPITKGAENLVGRTLAEVRAFELNRLNWIGWLLLLVTFGFVLGEAGVMALILGNGAFKGRVESRLMGLGMVFLAIGFFAGLRLLLRVLGISIYRW